MIRRPPRSTRTDTLFPYTTLFRSPLHCIRYTFLPFSERGKAMNDVSELLRSRKYDQGRTWSAWPAYEAAESGGLNYWYRAAWASGIGKNTTPARSYAVNLMLMRDERSEERRVGKECVRLCGS